MPGTGISLIEYIMILIAIRVAERNIIIPVATETDNLNKMAEEMSKNISSIKSKEQNTNEKYS